MQILIIESFDRSGIQVPLISVIDGELEMSVLFLSDCSMTAYSNP
jgi:hypothetical protein